jgi:hypothetical protein
LTPEDVEDAQGSISSTVFNYTSDKSTSLESSFTLTPSKPGCLIIGFVYKGASAYEYGGTSYGDKGGSEVSISPGGSSEMMGEISREGPNYFFEVLDELTPPAAPVLSSAQFSDSGNFVTLTFSTPTDTGSAAGVSGTYVDFPCSELFEFSTDKEEEEEVCRFTSKTTAIITVSSVSIISTGDQVTLKSGKLFADCDAEIYDCSGTSSSSDTTASVDLPEVPIVPEVVLTGATSVPSCGDISLDSSMSSGNGGRDWAVFQWTFQSTAAEGDTNDLASFMSAVNSGAYDPTLKIPASNLVPGESYLFKLSLTNFFGQSASSTDWFAVAVSNGASPTVTIEGTATRTIMSSDAVTLFAVGEAATCDGEGVIIGGSNYVWDGGDLESTSVDKR